MTSDQKAIATALRQGCLAAPRGADAIVGVRPGDVLAVLDALDTAEQQLAQQQAAVAPPAEPLA